NTTNSTLELVHIVFRHGIRTPVDTFPTDPYIKDTFEPTGWGHVTNAAKVELYDIGQQLQQRYKELLGPYYKPDLLLAEATASPRTVMSLQLVLAALFPPANTPMEWSSMLNWQPIPIYTEPVETDVRLRQMVPCPRYYEAVWEVMHLPEVVALHKQNAALLEQLTQLTGMNVSYAHDVTNVYVSLQAEQNYGLQLPQWTQDYYPERMLPLAALSYIYDAYTPELRRLKGGYYVADMLAHIKLKIAGELQPAGRKIFMACAHDWTISNVLNALNVWQVKMPRLSSLIAIELHRRSDNAEHFVEIYFQNDPKLPPQLLQVPGCEAQCPLEQLIELLADVLPQAPYEQLCVAKGTSDGSRISYH
ncbi:CG9451, partial [Drosophila busckii]